MNTTLKPPRQRMFDAVKSDNVQELRLAIADGAKVNERDDEGWSVLHLATVSKRKFKIRPGLIQGRGTLLVRGNAADGVFQELIERGADLNARDGRGNTPMHLAAGSGLVDVGRALIEAGADLSVRNENGATPHDYAYAASCEPLMRAIEARQAEALRQQLERNTAALPDLNDPATWNRLRAERTQKPKPRGMRL